MCLTVFHGLDGVTRQIVTIDARADRERSAGHVRHDVGNQCVEGGPQFGGRHPQHRLRGRFGCGTEDVGEFLGIERGRVGGHRHTARRALADRAVKQTTGGGGGHQRLHAVRSGTLPENRHILRVTAEGCDVVVHPLQGQHDIAQKQIAVNGVFAVGQRRQIEGTQCPHPVVHRDVHAPAPSQGATVIQRGGRATQEVTAAVDEEHHR